MEATYLASLVKVKKLVKGSTLKGSKNTELVTIMG